MNVMRHFSRHVRIVPATLLSCVLAACNLPQPSSDAGTEPNAPQNPVWLVGTWTHDDGQHLPYYLTLSTDGTFDWSTADEVVGNWSSDGSDLTFDAYQEGVDFKFLPACHVISVGGDDYYDAYNDTSDCPMPPAPLTTAEQCAVGIYTSAGLAGSTSTTELHDDRTYVESATPDDYDNGGYNLYGTFSIDASGNIVVTRTNGSSQERGNLKYLKPSCIP